MPLRFVFTYKTYIELGCYIILMFFIIPIRIEKDNEFEIREQFLNYLLNFNKSYPEDHAFNLRFGAFKRSLETINLLNINRTNSSAQYGLTKFSDMPLEVFMSFLNNRPKKSQSLKYEMDTPTHVSERNAYWKTLPKKIDWRDKHVVSKVKHQGECGACWAFAVTETIESMQAIKTNKLTELSIQQMIDCSLYNNGCQGGDTCSLLRWLNDYKVNILNESDYPLTLKDQECKKTNVTDGVKIKAFTCDSYVGREDIILKLLATNGPVTVGISGQTWQNYVGGVIQFHCDGHISHAVQVVGYDLTAEVPYYIVRNSWGEDFGDNGYLYVAIGSNVCGLAYEVTALTIV